MFSSLLLVSSIVGAPQSPLPPRDMIYPTYTVVVVTKGQPCYECMGNCQCEVCDCVSRKQAIQSVQSVQPATVTPVSQSMQTVCEGGVCRLVPSGSVAQAPVQTYSPPVTYSRPVYQQPTYSQPVYSQPTYSQPVTYVQPSYSYSRPTYNYQPQTYYRTPSYSYSGSCSTGNCGPSYSYPQSSGYSSPTYYAGYSSYGGGNCSSGSCGVSRGGLFARFRR